LFEITGPRALSFAQCAEEISEAVGYPVLFSQIGIDEFVQALADEGLDDESLWLMRELFTEVFDGRNSAPADGVQKALGRPASDFSTYLRKAIDSGAWSRDGLSLTA
ncbi:MAG: NmrA family transcriptional regulator, partial [Pseudomonadales bacterium]